jgi:hypothetical protein
MRLICQICLNCVATIAAFQLPGRLSNTSPWYVLADQPADGCTIRLYGLHSSHLAHHPGPLYRTGRVQLAP